MIINPLQKISLSFKPMGRMERGSMERFSGPLPLSQSFMVVLPYIITLIAITVICFAVSYVIFMRQEIRSM
jgi:ABC-2 type transport system permease protein